MAVVTQMEDGVDNMVFWPTWNFMQRDEYAIFSFRWKLCYEKEKTFIIPRCIMSQNLLNSSISRFSRNEKKKLHTNDDSNVKNHAISLIQMQGSPQSNIRKEITIFCFKETLKKIANHFKTKTTQTKFLF